MLGWVDWLAERGGAGTGLREARVVLLWWVLMAGIGTEEDRGSCGLPFRRCCSTEGRQHVRLLLASLLQVTPTARTSARLTLPNPPAPTRSPACSPLTVVHLPDSLPPFPPQSSKKAASRVRRSSNPIPRITLFQAVPPSVLPPSARFASGEHTTPPSKSSVPSTLKSSKEGSEMPEPRTSVVMLKASEEVHRIPTSYEERLGMSKRRSRAFATVTEGVRKVASQEEGARRRPRQGARTAPALRSRRSSRAARSSHAGLASRARGGFREGREFCLRKESRRHRGWCRGGESRRRAGRGFGYEVWRTCRRRDRYPAPGA